MAVLIDSVAQRRTEARQRWDAKTGADLYITVGMGTCGLAAGAQDTLDAIEAELERRNLRAGDRQVGCVGMCSYEPMVELQPRPRARHQLRPGAGAEVVPEIFAAYFDGAPLENAVVVGEVVPDVTVAARPHAALAQFRPPRRTQPHPLPGKAVARRAQQLRPDRPRIDRRLPGHGRLLALERSSTSLTPEQVIEEMIQSGLRGRGGGGFSTGTKWKLARQTAALAQVRHLQRGRG